MKLKAIAKIKTPRLIIRPISLNDVDTYFNAEQASIKEMSPYWSWAKPGKSINDIKEFISYALECQNKKIPAQLFFSLFTNKPNKFLGLLWFQSINWFVPTFEVSYWLDSRETLKGYMTEAVNAITRACFVMYGAKRIEIKIFADNKQSKRIPEKLGFALEGEMENYFINFVTKEITNGLLYACCRIDKLPALEIDIS